LPFAAISEIIRHKAILQQATFLRADSGNLISYIKKLMVIQKDLTEEIVIEIAFAIRKLGGEPGVSKFDGCLGS
jgi:hypothetical protein